MLTCREFLSELTDFLDESNSIDAALRQKLESHLSECPNCWVVCNTTKKTIQVYKGMEAQALPQDVHDRLLLALERKMNERSAEKLLTDHPTAG